MGAAQQVVAKALQSVDRARWRPVGQRLGFAAGQLLGQLLPDAGAQTSFEPVTRFLRPATGRVKQQFGVINALLCQPLQGGCPGWQRQWQGLTDWASR